ncbi:protein kinase domain-containing protein [Streptomyces sp. 11x1]|uniref:serine/threonine-protein kinase n=1 Tax=Streptomyces sp. 11x1 TaxID=3038642 RepID=UPI0037D9C79B
MGRVWRATDEILDRQVAVKEMRIDGQDPEDSRTRRERTLREARATARIDHPNVVRVYDVVDAGERLWIVMELVDGRSLERLVAEDGPLDAHDTARIGLELVDALGQVHAQGVLHRDIKPANVLIRRTGIHRAVLTDFGIAAFQNAEALTMAGMLVGSPDYMAPERVSGRPQGPPSDLWSLGATLCAALGGRSPFSRSTTLATLHAVLYEEPELPAAAGPLQHLLAALLDKAPEARPGLPHLIEALRAVTTPPAAAPQAARRPTEPAPPESEEPRPTGEPSEPAQGDPGADHAQAGRDDAESGIAAPGIAASATSTSGTTASGTTASGTTASGTTASGITTPNATAPGSAASVAADLDQPTASPPTPLPTPTLMPTPDERPGPPDGNGQPPTGPAPEAEATPPSPARHPTPAPHPTPPAHRTPTVRSIPEPDRATTPVLRGTPPSTPPSPPASQPPADPRLPESDPDPAPERSPHSDLPTRPRRTSTPTPAAHPTPTPTPMPSGELPGPPVPSRHTEPDGPTSPEGRGRRNRRIGLVAAAAVAVTAAVAAVVVPAVNGSPDDKGGKDDKASSSTTASPSASSPSPTVAGTSRPPKLLPGARTEAGVFAWVPPDGFSREVHAGAEVHYTSPDARQEIVGKASLARGDLLEQWRKKEKSTSEGPGYQRIRLEETEFRGRPAVVWEYTVTAQELPWHVRSLGFNTGGKSYQLTTWYHPDIEDRALPIYEKVEESFTPL